MKVQDDRDVTPLQIRTRQSLSGDDGTSSTQNVFCPARECSVPMSACHVCGHSKGFDVRQSEGVLLCDHDKARDARAVEPRRISADQRDRTPIRELMTTHVLCVRSDVSLESLRTLLLDQKMDAVPVVNVRGAPIGIVSKTDLVQYRHDTDDIEEVVHEQLEAGYHASLLVEATAADIMTPVPITLREDALIPQVAAVMAYERVHTLPIVAHDGSVVGIVSTLDIARWYAQRDGYMLGSVRRR